MSSILLSFEKLSVKRELLHKQIRQSNDSKGISELVILENVLWVVVVNSKSKKFWYVAEISMLCYENI